MLNRYATSSYTNGRCLDIRWFARPVSAYFPTSAEKNEPGRPGTPPTSDPDQRFARFFKKNGGWLGATEVLIVAGDAAARFRLPHPKSAIQRAFFGMVQIRANTGDSRFLRCQRHDR